MKTDIYKVTVVPCMFIKPTMKVGYSGTQMEPFHNLSLNAYKSETLTSRLNCP